METKKGEVQEYYEMYFDEGLQRPYYYNPRTQESLWEVPTGSVIADMTIMKPGGGDGKHKEGEKKEGRKSKEEAKREEYQKKKAQIEQLYQDNLQMMYPEYYSEQKENPIDQIQDSQLEKVEQAEVPDGAPGDAGYEQDYRLFKKVRSLQVQDLMQRPARRQVQESKKDTAYIEGNYDYNIWYDKYLTDRNQMVERAPSLYKCNPILDTGFTKADKFEKKGATYFCVYFARGACTEGVNCRFYHRVPQEDDLDRAHEDNLHDIFGRARHASHKEDFSGIGSFNKECRTLLVTEIQLPQDTLTPLKDMVRILYEFFSPWGEVEDIHFNSSKCHAFVKYKHRYYAEFAKEAMMDQVLTEGATDPINIKWAVENPFDKSEAARAQLEVQASQLSNKSQSVKRNNQKGYYLQPHDQKVDPVKELPLEARKRMRPEELVPQVANQAVRKREQKIMQKDRKREVEISKEFDKQMNK